jgi:O-antigen/teichoic acid export membrane protein
MRKYLYNYYSRYKLYLKSVSIYLFASVFTTILGIIVNPFMAKNLSPEDYAVIGYYNSFNVIILSIVNFSLISYYLRNYYLIPEDRRTLVSDTILIALLVYGFFSLTVILFIFYLYWKLNHISFSFYPYALLSFTPIFLTNFLTLFQINCRLRREAAKYTKISILAALINAFFAIALVVIFKYGASGKLFASLLSSLLISIYCFRSLFGKFQFDWNTIKAAIKFGWPLSISGIMWFFLSGVDRSMLEKLNNTFTFGFYNVGAQMAGYFGIFYTAIGQTFEPDIYKAIADNKKRKLAKIMAGIISINAIPNILFIMFAPLIIGLLTYGRYTSSSGFAQILALKNITITFYYCAITIIVGYGFTKSELLIRLVGSLICILMFKILINKYEFYGAAWGQVFSFIILAVIALLFIVFKFKQKKLQSY